MHESNAEHVELQRLVHGEPLVAQTRGGVELLVLDGALLEGGEAFARGSWLRLPPGSACVLTAGATGATLYLKTGHLAGLAA